MEYVGKTVGQGIKPIETYWGHKGERGGGPLARKNFEGQKEKKQEKWGGGGGQGRRFKSRGKRKDCPKVWFRNNGKIISIGISSLLRRGVLI